MLLNLVILASRNQRNVASALPYCWYLITLDHSQAASQINAYNTY